MYRCLLFFLIAIGLGACASVPSRAIDPDGKIQIRISAPNRYVIGGRTLYPESAIYVLSHLRSDQGASKVEFLVDTPLLEQKVRRDNAFYNEFKGCAQVELDAYLLAHDSLFGIPYPIFEYDSGTGKKGAETKCSGILMTLEV